MTYRAGERSPVLRAGECKYAPHISLPTEADDPPDPSYTLILADPDEPTPEHPKYAFWWHWVVSGLKPGLEARQR
ncbi:hypothetical protein F5Y05DRAFT_413565 [Hypoxylon sp. FL0543]|nr:hypothetical protein F5Y05DRAFT_413565 [Hypoxylon sp. FL0543]